MLWPAFDLPLLILAVTVFVAGVARGLAGFGTGMIVVPVAGALFGPQAAVVIIVLIDVIPALPVTVSAFRITAWKEVMPVLIGMVLMIPVGVWILTWAPELPLRLAISLAIIVCAVALWRGWRYTGRRSGIRALGVGGVAGVLSGVAQIPAPPVLVYWLASPMAASVVRANLLTLFFLATFVTIASLVTSGLFTPAAAGIGVAMMPVYFVGILAGWAFYGRMSDRQYRQITLMLVVLSALLSLPWRELGAFAG
ncbi:MAG: sulfite exporter TauE/SafE family protein [Mesorhizobium sp.]